MRVIRLSTKLRGRYRIVRRYRSLDAALEDAYARADVTSGSVDQDDKVIIKQL